MTTEKLLESLRSQHESLGHAILVIQEAIHANGHVEKRASILNAIQRKRMEPVVVSKNRKRNYNGNHWTQTPEGKKKLAAQSKAIWASKKSKKRVWSKKQHAKFRATMKRIAKEKAIS